MYLCDTHEMAVNVHYKFKLAYRMWLSDEPRCICFVQQPQNSERKLQNLQPNSTANINLANRDILSGAMLMCGNPRDFQVQSLSTGEVLLSIWHGELDWASG